MKRIVVTILLACASCAAQNSGDARPAVSNVPGAEYPRIYPDLRIEFRLKAPDAQKVQVQVGGATLDLVKNSEGVWSGISSPQVPGFHYYSIVVDGVAVNDPASKTYFGVGRDFSGLEVPEVGVDFYTVKDVPHGEVREVWYY